MNLPLVGSVHVTPVPAGAPAATFLAADNPDELKPAIDILTQTRKSLTLRSLFVTGFPHDPEFFAAGVALARQWSRQGLRIAVVDMDYRHPTVVRPHPSPNEGLVDALEYGCSFQRIAWELVQDALWLVGPGSHPPDEARFPEHPDWTRVMRVFSSRVDVALYLAPMLDKKGFTGALSKRMDGVIFATCVRRSSRAALRDAFLELWGSDAPMIGCLGIDSPHDPAPPREKQIPAEAPAKPAPQPPPKPAARVKPDVPDTASPALVAKLSDEVRRGQGPPTPSAPGSRAFLIAAVAFFLAGVGAFATYQAMHRAQVRTAAPAETLPAGTEPTLPADLGTSATPSPAAGSGDAVVPAPAPATTEAPAVTEPDAPPAKASDRNFEIHVASFSTDQAAKREVRRLREQGIDAWYAKATDQARWYRVFVGHYATLEEAATEARSMLSRGLADHAVAFPQHAR